MVAFLLDPPAETDDDQSSKGTPWFTLTTDLALAASGYFCSAARRA
jgi:hypothetical protein